MEQLCKIQYNKDYYVVIANALIRSAQSMTWREQMLLYIAVSQIVKSDKDFKMYTTTVPELATFMGIEPDSLYRDLGKICKQLMSRMVEIEGKDDKDIRFDYFHFVERATYEKGILYLKLSDEIKPYLLDLKSYYTQARLYILMSFNTYYASRLYLYLRACYGEQSRKTMHCCFTMEELRELFQTGSKYKSSKDLVKKTIRAALDEVEIAEDAYISNYQEIKSSSRGNPLESIVFDVQFFRTNAEKKSFLYLLEKAKTRALTSSMQSIQNNKDIIHCSEENFTAMFSDLCND